MYLTAKNFKSGGLQVASVEHISRESFEKLFRERGSVPAVPRSGDVLVSIIGTLGEPYIVRDHDEFGLSSSVAILRPSRDRLLPQYLYYWMRSPSFQDAIYGIKGGVAQSYVSLGMVKSLPVLLVSLEAQRKIAAVLSALDDLIENNRRRVEALEEMARAIYREWFVHFRYPGHESATFLDSPLGGTPQGWVVSNCGDELSFIGGGTPSKKVPTFWEGGTVRWYTPSDLTKNRWRYAAEPELRITEAAISKSSARLFPEGSVLMTSRATLGVLAIATRGATTNQGFIVMLPDERWSPGFIREWLDAHAEELAAIGTGATFKEITKGALKRFPFVVPAQGVLDAYRLATDPLEEQIQNLEREIRNLRKLRDLLLPKLVSGQIDVSSLDLDALVEDSVV